MAWLTRSGSAGGRKVTVGLSAVGPPPLTSSSQLPAKRSTTLVPPYSRYGSAPSTSTQKSRDRAGSATTRICVTATSAPSGPACSVMFPPGLPGRLCRKGRPMIIVPRDSYLCLRYFPGSRWLALALATWCKPPFNRAIRGMRGKGWPDVLPGCHALAADAGRQDGAGPAGPQAPEVALRRGRRCGGRPGGRHPDLGTVAPGAGRPDGRSWPVADGDVGARVLDPVQGRRDHRQVPGAAERRPGGLGHRQPDVLPRQRAGPGYRLPVHGDRGIGNAALQPVASGRGDDHRPRPSRADRRPRDVDHRYLPLVAVA